jgi:carbon monoxide dehydrogenase subunit G
MPVRLDTEFGVAHGAHVVWARLHDVGFVATCFPGAELESVQADGGYAGVIRLQLGPTTARFRGIMHVTYDEDGQTATIRARGDDARRTKASATATLIVTADGDGHTHVRVDTEIEVVGSLAQFAQTGGAEVIRLLLRDFATAMEQRLDQAVPAAATAGQAQANPAGPAGNGSSDTPIAGAAVSASTGPPASADTAPIRTLHLIWRLIFARLARLRQRPGHSRPKHRGDRA